MLRRIAGPMFLLAAAPVWLTPASAATRSLQQRIDSYFGDWTRAGQFSGVVLVAKDNQLLLSRSYGRADWRTGRLMKADAVFPIASVTKSFTASAVIDLEQQGKLRFSDPLSRFLPRFPNAANITIDQLLRHQSGVGLIEQPRFFTQSHPLRAYVDEIARAKPLFAPGKGDEYSNEGYILLAAVIEQVSETPWDQYLRRRAFDPLRMTRTRSDEPTPWRAKGSQATLKATPLPLPRDESPLPGASGLQSNAGNLWRWMRALKQGQWGNYSALSYPYGWGRRNYEQHKLIEQSGSVEGFGSYVAAYEDGHYIIALSNVQSGMQGRWGEDLASILFANGIGSRPPQLGVSPDPHPPSAYEGDFANPSGGYPLRLRVRQAGLAMTWGTYPFWRPVAVLGPDQLIAMADFTRMKVARDADGKPARVLLTAIDGSTEGAPVFSAIK